MTKAKFLAALRRAARKVSYGGRFLLPQRILRRVFSGMPVTVRVHDFDGDLTLDLRLSEHMQSRMFWVEYYNQDIVALINRMVTEGMVFVDVGANIGEIAMIAAKRTGDRGSVIAFEPLDQYADALDVNTSNNHLRNVKVVRTALSDKVGMYPIYESCGQRVEEEHRGLNSLYPGPGELPLQTVSVTTLDEYFRLNPTDRVDFIKIDIEGAELPCLRGAARTLQEFKPHLIVEVQGETAIAAGYDQRDILDYLSDFGYQFSGIRRSGRLRRIDRDTLSAFQNVLCSPSGYPRSDAA